MQRPCRVCGFCEFGRKVAKRINNRYGHELKIFPSNERDSRATSKGKSDRRPRVTTLATGSDRNQHSLDVQPRAVPKCAQCSGLHGIPVQKLQDIAH